MNPSNNMYDITNYTDNQLFHILNLNQYPSDKELEASIILAINKYTNVNTENGKMLTTFFNNIYDHFFESENNEETNNDEDNDIIPITTIEPLEDNHYFKKRDDDKLKKLKINIPTEPDFKIESKSTITTEPTVSLTKNVEQIRGNLNPLLKQTYQRIICIDSQYRNKDKYSNSSEFTFNLSDTLKDVLSLKLYSVNIPYTWYTISEDYGGNFFYLKGVSPGINNGYHDYKIEIPSGYYSPQNLINAIKDSIKTLSTNYTDLSFGTTGINYGESNAKSTITVDITKIYNESDYYIDFNIFPKGLTNGRFTDIASFLGYTIPRINTNTSLISDYSFRSTKSDTPIYKLTDSNNYFTIYQYSSKLQQNSDTTFIPNYDESTYKTIDFSFNVILTLTTGYEYSRIQLYENLIQCLNTNDYLNSTSSISVIDLSNNKYILSNGTFINSEDLNMTARVDLLFQFTLVLNKKTTIKAVNEKMYIQFPDEQPISSQYKIWTNPESCFLFNSLTYELNNITSQKTVSTTLYKPTNAKIILTCIKINYSIPLNNYTFIIPPSTSGYNLYQYLNEINQAIKSNTLINNNVVNVIAEPGCVLFPLLNNDYNTNISDTRYLSFIFNFNKTFTKEYYTINLTGTILNELATSESLSEEIELSRGYVEGGDLSFNVVFNGSSYQITKTKPLLIIVSKNKNDNQYGNYSAENMIVYLNIQNATLNSDSPYVYYETIDSLKLDIENSINNYIDENDNDDIPPLKGSEVFVGNLFQGSTGFMYPVKINLIITKKLTQNDYKVTFQNLATIQDTSYISTQASNNNTTDILGLIFYGLYEKDDYGNTNVTYDLSNYTKTPDPNSEITYTYSEISGNLITSNLLDVGINNELTFYIRPIPNNTGGVYVSDELTDNNNVIPITLKRTTSTEYLTQFNVLQQINKQLNGNSLTKGSYVYNNYNGNTIFRLNIKKVYTANDYAISFYDPYSYVKCFIGSKSVNNITWDQTMGWILGFRNKLVYNLSDEVSVSSSNIKKITGESTVTTNLYNYFLIELNDYAQSHINDGLVTVSSIDNSITTLPSYANKYTLSCDNIGNTIYTGGATNVGTGGTSTTQSTQSQIYSVNQQLNERNNKSTLLTAGPYTRDIFAMIPIKAGSAGQTYVDFGGSLQNQNRIYFGPVNLSRFSVKLLNDRGQVLNLNGSDWGFSLLCELLYNI
jgi:hypothetical protein